MTPAKIASTVQEVLEEAELRALVRTDAAFISSLYEKGAPARLPYAEADLGFLLRHCLMARVVHPTELEPGYIQFNGAGWSVILTEVPQ